LIYYEVTLYKYRYTDRRNNIMSRELLSNLEAGCYGKMKVENGKIIFECITNNHTSPLPVIASHLVPAPSAPPLVEDNRIIDELRDELRETKEILASLEKQVAQLFRFRDAVHMPGLTNRYSNRVDFYSFNTGFIKFYDERNSNSGFLCYNVKIGNHDTPFLNGTTASFTDKLMILKTQLRYDMTNHIIIQPYNTITPDCRVIIKFIIDWMTTSPNNIQITVMNPGATLAIGFVVGLCEQLNPDKLSKLIITQAKISEQTEMRNKIDKTLFKKIEFEKVVSSV
jgi:hypothetical protein